ncbi:hypothetical protein NQ314_005077 [Rhamnusium bicolor]|uniref:Uncharacterized protein n=1 Tax=Rhamnusium bicolor TaxID=1586634 RepID=A0AAV8ZKP6_9CUCU|nr:hypothetical protein NQ314_005077 [Rhamnusium bicolor]
MRFKDSEYIQTFYFLDQTGLDISEDLNAFFTCMSCLLACSFFTYRHRKWSTFFNDVTNTSKFGKPADFDAVTKRGNRVSAINYWFGNICLIGYGVAALAEASHCRQLNEEKGLHEVCGTFVSVWLPIEGDKLWIQIVIFSCQMVTGYFIFPSVSVMIYLPWEASEVLISHINHFKSHFLRTFDEPTIQGRSNRLRFCIQYHIHILRMSNDLNLLVKYTVGHISLISALVFSCIGNQIFKVRKLLIREKIITGKLSRGKM